MIRELIRKHGHVAHTVYWTLLECMHWHGNGNVLKMRLSDFAHDCVTNGTTAMAVLVTLAGTSKVTLRSGGGYIEVEIKKFRERQAKLKSKIPSRLPQDSLKTPQQEEEQEQKDLHRHKGDMLGVVDTVDTVDNFVGNWMARRNPVRGLRLIRDCGKSMVEYFRRIAGGPNNGQN